MRAAPSPQNTHTTGPQPPSEHVGTRALSSSLPPKVREHWVRIHEKLSGLSPQPLASPAVIEEKLRPGRSSYDCPRGADAGLDISLQNE